MSSDKPWFLGYDEALPLMYAAKLMSLGQIIIDLSLPRQEREELLLAVAAKLEAENLRYFLETEGSFACRADLCGRITEALRSTLLLFELDWGDLMEAMA